MEMPSAAGIIKAEEKHVFQVERVLAVIQATLVKLDLAAIQVEDWLLFQRKRFDLKIMEEPYHGLQTLFSLADGKFVRRVWGKTVQKVSANVYKAFTREGLMLISPFLQGLVQSVFELASMLESHFHLSVPCLGFFDFDEGFTLSREDLVPVEYPLPRVISKVRPQTSTRSWKFILVHYI